MRTNDTSITFIISFIFLFWLANSYYFLEAKSFRIDYLVKKKILLFWGKFRTNEHNITVDLSILRERFPLFVPRRYIRSPFA
jgi:hypothetical protein